MDTHLLAGSQCLLSSLAADCCLWRTQQGTFPVGFSGYADGLSGHGGAACQGRARKTPHVVRDQAGMALCGSVLIRKLKTCQAAHHGCLQALCSSPALGLGHLDYQTLCADCHANSSRHPAGC